MTDDEIESHLLRAGYKPGTPVTATVLRGLVRSISADVIDSLLDVRKRYVMRPGDRYDRQTATTSMIVAENCLRAVCSTLGVDYSRLDK